MTLHAFTQYLRYRWHARGRHGTHSPFVYRFVEEVLRKREGSLESRILRYAGQSQFTPLDEIETVNANSVVIARKPHTTPEATARWNALCARPDARLSIDLYHTGLLFFREEFKAKQHFVLR